jgi:ankyrin repeat protein
VVEEILSWRVFDVSMVTDRGDTSLHVAAVKGFLRVAELLVAAGADVNAVINLILSKLRPMRPRYRQ